MDSISYHERVVAHLADRSDRSGDAEQARREAAGFYRLFLVPGMEHCRGGAGPDAFDGLGALVRWVEDGIAPDRIVATRFESEGAARRPAFSRPLCPFPRQARYRGQGDPDDAGSFACAAADAPPRDLPTLGADYLR
jgi:feruloyl esterase